MGCDKCGNRLELREGKKVGDNIYCHDCWCKEGGARGMSWDLSVDDHTEESLSLAVGRVLTLKAENARLKELNQEMVEGLNEIKEVIFSMDIQDSNMIHRVIDATIAKAEEEG